MLWIKFVLIASLAIITIQDIKERKLYWFLPLLVLSGGAFLFYKSISSEIFLYAVFINTCFVLFLIMVVAIYSKYKIKVPLRQAFGLGDGLLFLALACCFNTITFMVTFIFSLIFSLGLHLIFKHRATTLKTVPLAGYMSLFYIFVYLSFWLGFINTVYYI